MLLVEGGGLSPKPVRYASAELMSVEDLRVDLRVSADSAMLASVRAEVTHPLHLPAVQRPGDRHADARGLGDVGQGQRRRRLARARRDEGGPLALEGLGEALDKIRRIGGSNAILAPLGRAQPGPTRHSMP